MTNSQAKSELMQLYGSLSEEKKKAIDTVLNPLSDDDYTELRDRFGTEVESVVRDMISGKGERWNYMSLSEPMTREEVYEKLMERYSQGRADEKAYHIGEIMQSFNPD